MAHYLDLFKTNKRFFVVIIISAFIICGFTQQSPDTKIEKPVEPKKVYVTVLVHGIISVKPFLTFSNFVKLIRDNISDSTYARTVEIIRKDPFFYQYHPMQNIGLHKIDLDLQQPGAAATAYARAFHTMQPNNESVEFLYYTFGWSGLLSPRMRYLEAKLFYQSLSNLDAELRTQNYEPHYTIVGYSHGGNVVFKMAEIHNDLTICKKDLVINRLWLIGVPVLPDSLPCLHNPFFKEIVHLYSVRDRIQPLDCFALNRFFSSRMFTETNQLNLPCHLTQIKLSIRRPIRRTYSSENNIYTNMLRRSQLRNADPGHTELWSFGWTGNYRSHLPFYPLPASVFMPFIMSTLTDNNIYSGNVALELHPYCNKMRIFHGNKTIELPFLTAEILATLTEDALEFRPPLFSIQEFKQRILKSLEQAKLEKRTERERQEQVVRETHPIRPESIPIV